MLRALASDSALKRYDEHKLDSGEKKDAGLSASGEVDAQERKCYLDFLPDNVLENIMRLMSITPRASAWAEQLAEPDICTLFSVGGEVERVAREWFSSLSVNALLKDSHPVSEWRKPRSYRLAISSTKMSTANLINLASPSITALEIRDPLSNLFEQPADVDEFLRKCPNLSALKICSASTPIWLEKLGSRLGRLEIRVSSPSVCRMISGYCTELRELHIEEARKFSVGRSNLWAKVGGKLEKLTITFMFSSSMEIRKIQQHCRKIRWLHIPVQERVNPAFAECLVSYGEQLEYAFLVDMNESQLEAIVTACPNAKFHMSMEESCHGKSLGLVGSCLEKVVLFRYGVNDLCSLVKGWNACHKIEVAWLHYEVSLSYVRALFTKPKPDLLELELQVGFAEEMPTVREIVDCIADGTGALRRFKLTSEGIADGLFDKLVAQNQSLQEFICTADLYEPDGRCDVAKIAESILELPRMKRCWIYVENPVRDMEESHNKLEELVRQHRHRDLGYVLIGHYYYLL